MDFQSSVFWVMVHALKQFVEKEKALPLPGTVPDMKADTERYVALQTVYRAKGKRDLEVMRQWVQSALQSAQLPKDYVQDEVLETFCKNAAYLKCIRYRTITQEYQETPRVEEISALLVISFKRK